MVSKNNFQNKQEEVAQRTPHYGLRKLSLGVASVLLSTSLYWGMTGVAHADTTIPTDQAQTTQTTEAQQQTVPTTPTANDQQNGNETAEIHNESHDVTPTVPEKNSTTTATAGD